MKRPIMLKSVALKSVAFAAVATSTWFITAAIKAKPLAAQSANPRIRLLTPEEVAALPSSPSSQPIRIVSRSKMKFFDVQADGNTVRVVGIVHLVSRPASTVYLWRIRIDQGEVTQFDRAYTEQLFEMPASGTLTPTFAEEIQVPYGIHRAALTLYAMPKGYDIKKLNDPKVDKAMAIIHVHKEVVVQ